MPKKTFVPALALVLLPVAAVAQSKVACDRLGNGMQTTHVPFKPGEKKPDLKTAFQIESKSLNN